MSRKIKMMIKLFVKYNVKNRNLNIGKKEEKNLIDEEVDEMIIWYQKRLKVDNEMKCIKGDVKSKALLAREVTGNEWQYSNARQTFNLIDLVRQEMILSPYPSQQYQRCQFLLKYKMYWSSGQKPDSFSIMQVTECYHNSFWFCRKNTDFAYVEGFYRGNYEGYDNLTSHAWVTDLDGNIIDATYPAPNACEYIGVPLNIEFVKINFDAVGEHTWTISKDNDRVDMDSISPRKIIDSRFSEILLGKDSAIAEEDLEEINVMQGNIGLQHNSPMKLAS